MVIEWVELGIGLGGVILGGFLSWRFIDLITSNKMAAINNKIDTIIKVQAEQCIILEKHDSRFNRYLTNDGFYSALNETAGSGIEMLKDNTADYDSKDKCYRKVDDESCNYLLFSAKQMELFARNVISRGIDDKLSNTILETEIKLCIKESKAYLSGLFNEEIANRYFKQNEEIHKRYIENVLELSEDWINDKAERFRTISYETLQRTINNFIKFVIQNHKILEGICQNYKS